MDKPQRDGITRRDFLDGVAISAAGLAAAAAAPHLTGAEAALAAKGRKPPAPLPPGYHPPTDTGLTGTPDRVVKQIMKIDGRPNPQDVHSTRGGPGFHAFPHDDGEITYDCVIVGAGASGLAAAKFYRDRFGEDSKILLLDPLPDFGGHSHRNEFHIPGSGGDVMLLRNGGTVNLDSVGTWNETTGGLLDIPGEYGQPALDMLEFCEVDWENFPSTSGPGIPSSFGMRQMLLFPAKDWGQDYVVQNRTEPNTAAGWAAFLARTPWSKVQADVDAIVRIQTDATTDPIVQRHGPKTDQEKKAILSRLTYRQWLMDYMGASERALLQYQRLGHGLLGAGAQAVSAGDMWALGNAGFRGLGLNDDFFVGIGRTPQFSLSPNAEPSPTWPDGNASLLRLLVGRLIPGSIGDVDGAPPTMETIVKAQADYTKLDRPGNAVRIRLNSLVFRVKPGKRSETAKVDYILDNRARRVEARHVVMACWNRVTAHVVEGLPKKQVEGLCYARKVPLIYGRAGLNDWKAFADARINNVSPRGNSLFWDSTALQAGARFGSAYGPTPNDPSQPAIVTFQVVATEHRATPQLAAYEGGRQRLLEMSFRDLENAFVDVLDRTLNKNGGDFDPERDIHSLMVNRWNYGYAHELTSVWDPSLYGPVAQQPQVIGRQPYRNVAVANSDSAAFAYTHSAIDEGYRAVQDLPD